MANLDTTGAYAMYLRKSRKDDYNEDIAEVLQRHKTTLTALAKNMNIHITKIYQEVVSGETIANRPEVQNLLRDVEQGTYAGVLVMEVERLARGDAIDQGIIQRTFFVTGTKIITPLKIYDPLNEFDEEYFEYGLFRSRSEYKTIRRRINAGRIHSVREGKWIASTAPYGFERTKLQKERGYTLTAVPEEARVVKLIFDLYTNGKDGEIFGAGKISNYLDALGVKPRVSNHWSAATIRDMLRNPAYVGKCAWGRGKDVKSVCNGEIITKQIRQTEYILCDAIWDPIIPYEIFEKAAEIRKSHIKPSVKKTDTLMNPLSGLVYCEKCGRLMTRLGPNKKNRYSTLRCMNKDCDNISAPIYAVEDEIIHFLKDWLQEEQITFDGKGKVKEPESLHIISNQISGSQSRIDELKSQLEKTYELLEKGLYSEELFVQRQKKLTSDITEQERKLAEFKNTRDIIISNERRRNVWIPKTMSLLDSYTADAPPDFKNALLHQLIEKVTYLKTEKNHRGTVDNRNFTLKIMPKFHQVSDSDT